MFNYLEDMIEILKNIPKRAEKPRDEGLTMVMDKGLSLNEAENMVALKSTNSKTYCTTGKEN